VQPTLLLAPPEFWRKLYLCVRTKLHEQGPGPAAGVRRLPKHKLLSVLWSHLGCARVRFGAVGYGHLPPEAIGYLRGLGLPLYQMYGLSEMSGVVCLHSPSAASPRQLESAGLPLPGISFRFSPTNELLISGPNLFLGYYRNEEATSRQLKDGWLHTGDFGRVDEEGYLHLSGRGSGLATVDGVTINLERIENALKLLPIINNVLVLGHNQPYLTAVVSLDPYALTKKSKTLGVPVKDLYHMPHIHEITASIKKHVAAINKKLPKGHPPLKRFTVLRKQFSIEKGELTPTMQVRRYIVEQNYITDIQKMYPTSTIATSTMSTATTTTASNSTTTSAATTILTPNTTTQQLTQSQYQGENAEFLQKSHKKDNAKRTKNKHLKTDKRKSKKRELNSHAPLTSDSAQKQDNKEHENEKGNEISNENESGIQKATEDQRTDKVKTTEKEKEKGKKTADIQEDEKEYKKKQKQKEHDKNNDNENADEEVKEKENNENQEKERKNNKEEKSTREDRGESELGKRGAATEKDIITNAGGNDCEGKEDAQNKNGPVSGNGSAGEDLVAKVNLSDGKEPAGHHSNEALREQDSKKVGAGRRLTDKWQERHQDERLRKEAELKQRKTPIITERKVDMKGTVAMFNALHKEAATKTKGTGREGTGEGTPCIFITTNTSSTKSQADNALTSSSNLRNNSESDSGKLQEATVEDTHLLNQAIANGGQRELEAPTEGRAET
jgi:hypothetical protein